MPTTVRAASTATTRAADSVIGRVAVGVHPLDLGVVGAVGDRHDGDVLLGDDDRLGDAVSGPPVGASTLVLGRRSSGVSSSSQARAQ